MAEPEHIEETIQNKSDTLFKVSKVVHCDTCGSDGHPTSDHGKMGGIRANQGRPKGSILNTTKEKKAVKAEFDRRVRQHADRLFNAQLNLAVGETVLMVKEYVGEGKNRKVKHTQVTDIDIISQFLDENNGGPTTLGEDDSWYYLTTRQANNQAIDSLLNRGFGKPTEKVQVEGGTFFKADTLNIQIISGHKVDEIEQEIIDVEPED